MKKTTTRRALVMSVLSLLLCVSMLVGSTFAWFTDSVVSANNIIKSGNLDVAMMWADGKEDPANATWTDASTGPIFNYDLWEPGYTEVRHMQIINQGSLALKYQLNIAANGEVSKLAEVIDVYYADPAQQIADRTALAGVQPLTTLDQALLGMSQTAYGELQPGQAHTVTIALKMQESAGNEYQDLSIGSDFSVMLMATQLTYEDDSFDNQYDVNATYLNQDADGAWLINNMDELFFFANDVNSGNDYRGQTVKLTADIDLAGYNWLPIGAGDVNGQWIGFNGIFDGQNHTISNMKITKAGGWNGLFGLVGRGTSKVTESISNVTVKNVEIPYANRMSGAVVGQMYGNVENCHAENVTITAVPNWIGTEYDNGDKVGGVIGWFGDNGNNHYIKGCTAKNVTLKAYRDVAGIVGYIGSTSTVENCAVDTVSILVDQATNYYGDKDANAGAIVGRIAKQPVTVQNNTEANVDIVVPQTAVSVATAAELQAALDNAADVNLIVLTADIEGDVTAKQISNLEIIIDGAKHKYAGSIIIDGASAAEATSSITLKNINFVAESISKDACVLLGDGTAATRYTSNVTIENCTFDVPDKPGFISYTGGDKNLKVIKCTTTARAHSLGQPKGVQGMLIDGCTVNSIRGISVNNSLDVVIQNSTFNVQKYAVRYGSDENTTVENYKIINCTLTSACVGGDAVIILRAGATNANLTITNSTYTGSIPMIGHENANLVIN